MNVLIYCYIQNFMSSLKNKHHPSKSHRDSIYVVGFACCPCVILMVLGSLREFHLITLFEQVWPYNYSTTSGKDFSSPIGVVCILVGVCTIVVVRILLLTRKQELKRKFRLVEWKKINVLTGDNFPLLIFAIGLIGGFITLVSFYIGVLLIVVIWLTTNKYLMLKLK